MEFVWIAVAVLVVALMIVGYREQRKQVAAEAAAAAEAWAAAERREAELAPRLAAASSPADVLSLCGHGPPPGLRFQKSEEPLWVVPSCEYVKTTKEVTYHGGSGGASFRVAKGVTIRTGSSRGRREETEQLTRVDAGTVVLTTKHIYFQGEDKERFRVRLDKLVSAQAVQDGFLFQRDGVRAQDVVEPGLDCDAAGVGRVRVRGDGVAIRRVGRRVGQHDTAPGNGILQPQQQRLGVFAAVFFEHPVEGFEPLALLNLPVVGASLHGLKNTQSVPATLT